MASLGNEDEEDDVPVLSADTLALLQSFYTDRDESLSRFAGLKSGNAIQMEQVLSMDMFSEDWNASQFWYNDATATLLGKQLLHGATATDSIAVVSTPSVFIQLKNLLIGLQNAPQIHLLEFDDRFGILEEFVKYDFEKPLQLPANLQGRFDRIICDPPFHSRDCQTKIATTVEFLSKKTAAIPQIIICTGESMEDMISKIYTGVRPTNFEIVHERSRLKSEYVCYANFESDLWRWRGVDENAAKLKPNV